MENYPKEVTINGMAITVPNKQVEQALRNEPVSDDETESIVIDGQTYKWQKSQREVLKLLHGIDNFPKMVAELASAGDESAGDESAGEVAYDKSPV